MFFVKKNTKRTYFIVPLLLEYSLSLRYKINRRGYKHMLKGKLLIALASAVLFLGACSNETPQELNQNLLQRQLKDTQEH